MRLRLATPFLLLCCFFITVSSNPDGSDTSISAKHGSYPVRSFVSSKTKAPVVDFHQRGSACNDGGYYFITPRGWKVSEPGPMILDGNGNLIWTDHFSNQFGGQAYDLRVQKYRGQDYLTFWLGDDRVRGHGAGHYYILNSSYNLVHKFGAANNQYADLHEFTITPDNTALLIIFEAIQADVRSVGRKFSDLWNQAAYDCLFQEVSLETGEAVFEWRASQHINMTDSYVRIESLDQGTREKPFDFIHLNSVDKDEAGNYLISGRNLHAILYIDGKTGEVIWTLGGKSNDFKDVSGGHVLNMAWQHDARFVASDAFPKTYTAPKKKKGTTTRLMTIFDNAALDWNYEYGPAFSRGMLVEVTYPTTKKPKAAQVYRRAEGNSGNSLSEKDYAKFKDIDGTGQDCNVRLVKEFVHSQHVRSSTQGSVQLLPHGKKEDPSLLVGYGINAVITEFGSNGSALCDMHFGSKTSWETGDVQSYRAYKSPWIGRPRHPPSVAIRHDVAYVSWNGATEVREWLLVSSTKPDGEWREIAKVAKAGFETAIPLGKDEASGRFVRILAIDESGQICERGVSSTVDRSFFARFALPGSLPLLTGNSPLLLNVAVVSAACAFAMALLVRVLRRRRSSSRGKSQHHAD